MVNVDKVKRKLPGLCDGVTGTIFNDIEFMRNRYRLQQFQKHNPEKFSSLMVRLVSDQGF